MPTLTLITGGARSGKSRHALELAGHHPRKVFIATAEACDGEMADRIAQHRAERGPDFPTVEAPLDLAGALRGLPPGTSLAVVDCLTVWLANLMHHRGWPRATYDEIQDLLAVLDQPPCDLILVGNEVGLGIVPEHAMARHFRDLSGMLHQQVARKAQQVLFMVSGIPMTVKGMARPG